jgi:hypothetical protein
MPESDHGLFCPVAFGYGDLNIFRDSVLILFPVSGHREEETA